MKKAVAYANNDVAFIAWTFDRKIPGCLGFAIRREDVQSGKKTVLPAWVGFKNQSNTAWKARDTTVWPVQKFNWCDFTAERGKTYRYEITPMTGTPDNLVEDTANRLKTGPAAIVPGKGSFQAYFNRGILSTQHVAHAIPQGPGGVPDVKVLKDRIDQPGDPLRVSLAGQMIEALSSILLRAKNEGGECYLALYELNDPELLQLLIGNRSVHIVLGNTGPKDDVNVGARQALHESGVDITDRMLASGHIAHNKFVVYTDASGTPRSVLLGSTNWTYNALCAQTNNTLIIESPDLAGCYLDYWKRLRAEGNSQDAAFRSENHRGNPPLTIDGSEVTVWFTPTTKQQTKPAKNPPEPVDFAQIAEAIGSAEQAVLFLVFQPGTPSIIECVADRQNAVPGLFVRGAATDPTAVQDYNVHLYHRSVDDKDVVAASAVDDQFAYWQKELKKAGFAIIHDKIVVIDPMSDHCAVITGSHNLGYTASYKNDENFVIVRGNRDLAQRYAVHVIDTYDHYRWRYQLGKKNGGTKAFFGLDTDDRWQDKYFATGDPAKKDLRIWFE